MIPTDPRRSAGALVMGAVVACFLTASGPAWGQLPQAPPLQAMPPHVAAPGLFSMSPAETAFSSAETAGVAAVDSVGIPASAVCCEGYWIVSSRQCPQRGKYCIPPCEFDYFRYTPQTGLCPDHAGNFAASMQPDAPVCVVVHGSYVNWKSVQIEAQAIYHWLRSAAPHQPLNFVFYTWPSNHGGTLVPHLDIAILGKRSSFNAFYLAQLISQIPGPHPICLVGHSHGARMVVSTLHLLGGGAVHKAVLGYDALRGRRLRAVLVAAAVDHHWLNPGQRYDCALSQAECLLNVTNRRDFAMAVYPLRAPFSRRALGRVDFTHKDHAQLGWQSMKLANLDVTPIVGPGHMWPNYYEHPGIAWALAPYIYFADASVESE